MNKLFLVIITSICISCKSDSDIIAENNWKYMEGYRLSDWLSNVSLRNDTLYIEKQPAALLISTEFLYDHYNIKIRSLESKQTGIYTSK